MSAHSESAQGWHVVLDYTPFPDVRKGLRVAWPTPSRSGIYRLVPPWVYRHPRFFGVAHIAAGSVTAAAGLICLAYGVPSYAAFFLAIAALHLAGGYWYLTIDRSASAPA